MQRQRAFGDALVGPIRRALVALVVFVSSFAATAGNAAAPLAPNDTASAATTSNAATGGTNERTGRSPVAGTESEDRQAPHDAPRLGPGRLLPTNTPPGYSLFDGGWIRFYYHPSMRQRVEALISESNFVRRDLTERLGVPVLGRVRVDIARTPGEMATLAPVGAPYPDYAAGVAYPEIGLVLLTLAPVHATDQHDVVQVFRHELAHIALFDAVASAHVPRWFNEGFAVLVSGETSATRLQTLWTATLADTLLPLDKMERGFPRDENTAEVAYAQAVDVVRYLVREQDQFRFRALIERLRAGEEFPSALLGSYGIDLLQLEREWREDIAKRYTFWPVLFSGTFVWAGIIGLFFAGWRRRRLRAQATLHRWAAEEAREDQARTATAIDRSRRVHIVLARAAQATASPLPPTPHETDVPKVQHEGQWHTLH